MKADEIEYLYRYEEIIYSSGVDEFDNPLPDFRLRVQLRRYWIIKKTPKGAWISLDFFGKQKNKKFVLLKSARKKFACLTKEEAMKSFVARKKRQIQILKHQLEVAERALRQVTIEEDGHGKSERECLLLG